MTKYNRVSPQSILTAVLLLLVIMGMNNRESVRFILPPLMAKSISLQAAYMYFAFFAVGVIAGTVLTAGGKKGGSAKSNKPGN